MAVALLFWLLVPIASPAYLERPRELLAIALVVAAGALTFFPFQVVARLQEDPKRRLARLLGEAWAREMDYRAAPDLRHADRLRAVVAELNRIDRPDLRELRDMSCIRYLDLIEIGETYASGVRQYIRQHQLSAEVWPRPSPAEDAVREATCLWELLKLIDQMVQVGRTERIGAMHEEFVSTLDALDRCRRPDTDKLLDFIQDSARSWLAGNTEGDWAGPLEDPRQAVQEEFIHLFADLGKFDAATLDDEDLGILASDLQRMQKRRSARDVPAVPRPITVVADRVRSLARSPSWLLGHVLLLVPRIRERATLERVWQEFDYLADRRSQGRTPARERRVEDLISELRAIRGRGIERQMAGLLETQGPIWAFGADDWNIEMVDREIELSRLAASMWPGRKATAERTAPPGLLARAFFAYERFSEAVQGGDEHEVAHAYGELAHDAAPDLAGFVAAITRYVDVLGDESASDDDLRAAATRIRHEMDSIWPDVRVFRGA